MCKTTLQQVNEHSYQVWNPKKTMTWNNRNTTQSKLQNAYVNKFFLKNNDEKKKGVF
jgi:hypothetical protein